MMLIYESGTNVPDTYKRLRSQVAARTWPTPTVFGNYNRKGATDTSGDGLATAVKMWPTPLATDGANGGPNQRGGKGDLRLSSAVHRLPTPRSRDWKDSGSVPPSRMDDPGKDSLGQFVASSDPGGSLNPTWVEWLMGWPIGWTDCDASAMDKFQQWLRSHGKSSAQNQALSPSNDLPAV